MFLFERARKVSRRRPYGRSLAAAMLILAGCGILDPEIGDVGTVTLFGGTGSCWLLVTPSETYFPINLLPQHRAPGVRLQFEAKSRPDVQPDCPGLSIQLTFTKEIIDEG